MNVRYLYILLVLCVVCCKSAVNTVDAKMEELRHWERMSGAYVQDSIIYQCHDKKFHFLEYAYAFRDTIVMYATTESDTVWLGGISLLDDELSTEGDKYYHNSFDSLWMYTFNDRMFFIARAVNAGTACVHRDYMFYINSDECTLQQVKVVRAADVYEERIGLPDSLAIWEDEGRFFEKDSIYSVFCIWNSYDPNCCPTYGEVHSKYELEEYPDSRLVLVPKTFHFTPYPEDYHPSWSGGTKYW